MLDEGGRLLIGQIAGGISFVAYVLYYISIVQGRSRPNRATWIILTVVGVLIAASYYAAGARSTMWVAIAYTVGPFIAAILSFKYGEGGTTRFDIFCLVGCALSVVLWIFFKNPVVVLVINIVIDFLGILPTLKKSYLDPASEDRLAWSVTTFSNVLNIFAIEAWIFSVAVYPVYMVIVNGLVTAFIFRKSFFTR
jgi:hypothetical protein